MSLYSFPGDVLLVGLYTSKFRNALIAPAQKPHTLQVSDARKQTICGTVLHDDCARRPLQMTRCLDARCK